MGSIVSGIFGSNAGSPPNLQVWQPSGTGQADQTWQNLTQYAAGNNPYQTLQPQYGSVLNSSLNNPYATGFQNAANTAGGAYTNAGNSAISGANALSPGAMNLLSGANSVYNTALNPQSGLYNQTLQQVTDQQNAQNAASGVTGSGYGQNLMNQDLTNFNIGWQNNLLGLQEGALGAEGTAVGNAGNALTGASNLGTAGAGNLAQGGSVPYSASSSVLANMLNALNSYGSSVGGAGNSLALNTAGTIQPYLNLAAGQSDQQAQLTEQNWLNQNAYDTQQNQQLSDMVNGGLGGINSLGSTFIPQTWNAGTTGGSATSMASLFAALGLA